MVFRVSFESIYMHSLATIEITHNEEFKINFNSWKIIELDHGEEKRDGLILSVLDENKHRIKMKVADFISEKPVYQKASFALGNHYGMRFFPFISSIIDHNFSINTTSPINFLISVPDKFRFIYSKSTINGEHFKHSYGVSNSEYLFELGLTDKSNQDVNINLAIRLGGSNFLGLITFPIVYWMISLLAVVMASIAGNMGVVVGAIAAVWLFILRHWKNSNLPQQDTILTKLYATSAVILGVWGIGYELFGSKILVLVFPIITLIIGIVYSNRHFKLTGELPQNLAKYLAKSVESSDSKRSKER